MLLRRAGGHLCASSQGDDGLEEGCERAPSSKSSPELCAREDEEPAQGLHVTSSLQKSAELMEAMQSLRKISEIQAALREPWSYDRDGDPGRVFQDTFESINRKKWKKWKWKLTKLCLTL